jgi:hypothetical protein
MAKRHKTSPVALLRLGVSTSVLGAPAQPAAGKGESVKLVSWGAKDNLPQECIRVVYDSGTAEACVTRLAQFIGGKGFASEATASARANDEQTLNDILAEAKHYAAMGFGVALVVRFTYGGQRGDVFVEPADCLRREKDGLGRYIVNYGLSEGKRATADNRIYLPYNPLASKEEIAAEVLAAVQSDAGYWGHLVHSFEARPGRTQYPVPAYYAAKEDLETDAALAKFDKKQAGNGFFPDAVATVIGARFASGPDEEFEPAVGQSKNDAPWVESPDMTAFKSTIKQLKGSESESSVLVVAVDTVDEVPKIEFIDKGPNSKGLTDMRGRITGAVCRHIGVPPELIGIATPGVLGNNQQIVNLIRLFNLTVEPKRAEVTSPLAKIYPELTDWSVKPLNPVDYLDPEVAAKMTDDEIRAFGGLSELEKPQSTEAERTLQALAGLDALVANKVLEDLTEDERRALVGLGPKTTTKPKPKA